MTWSMRGRWLLAVVVFAVLPYLLVSFYLGRSWRQEFDERVERSALRLETTLMLCTSAVRKDANLLGFLLDREWERILRRPVASRAAALERLIETFQRAGPGAFRFHALDRNGAPLLALPAGSPPVEDWQRLAGLMEEARQGKRAKERVFSANLPFLRRLVGPLVDQRFFPLGVRFFCAPTRASGAFPVFFAVGSARGFLFVEIAIPPDQSNPGVDLYLKFLSKGLQARGLDFGFIGSANRIDPKTSPTVRAALGALGQSSSLCRRFGRELVAVSPFGSGGFLWLRRSLEPAFDLVERKRRRLAWASVLIGIWALVLFRVMVNPERWYPSLRLRLIALFLFACGLPLLAVWLAGKDYLHEKRLILRSKVWENLSARLLHFDRRLREENRLLARRLRNEARDFGKMDLSELERRLFSLTRKIGAGSAFVLDSDGKMLVRGTPKEFNPTELLALGSVGKRILGELNKTQSGKIDTAGLILDSIGKERETISTFMRNLGEFMDWDLGGDRNFLFFLPLKTVDGKKYHRFCAVHFKDFERLALHCQRRLFRVSRHLPGTHLNVFHPNFRKSPLLPIAREWRPYANALHSVKRLVQSRGRGVQALVQGPEEILVAGIRSPTLPESTYLAVHRGTAINEEIDGLRRRLAWFLLLALLFSALLGVHLGERFLSPLAQFGEGVDAISRGRFDLRLPARDPDEFGLLTESFNEAMKNLADLDLGRIFQEHLFPKGVCAAGEYRITGRSRCAAQLGGDIFDIRPLPDGKILALLGDVTGHGLGAALVMTMAWALICLPGTAATPPAEILQAIHRVLFKTMKRRRMMTCLIVVIDTVTHRITIANAGQCAPIRIHPGKPADLLITSSKPLGSWKTIEPSIETFDMEPGERLLLYSDGAVEAVAWDGHQIGFERLAGRAEEISRENPVRGLDDLYAWLERMAGPGLQADDVTCILVDRRDGASDRPASDREKAA